MATTTAQPATEVRQEKFQRKQIQLADFHAEAEQRFGPDARDWQLVCPACGTVQTARDFYAAGFEPGKGEVDRYLGFSCIGRWTKGKGCDWTLGGLFTIHKVELMTPDGKAHPFFELAELDPEKLAAQKPERPSGRLS